MIPVVLFGPTGCGKTKVLKELSHRGFEVIDLESFAVHRGSVFGQINTTLPQPSQAAFETSILNAMNAFRGSRLVFIEHEASNIGKLRLPFFVKDLYQHGVSVLLKASVAKRVQNIMEEYLPAENATLLSAFEKLKERLDAAKYNAMRSLLQQQRYAEFCYQVLDYYDNSKMYEMKKDFDIVIEDKGVKANVDELLQAPLLMKEGKDGEAGRGGYAAGCEE